MVENFISACIAKHLLRFIRPRLPNCARAVGAPRGLTNPGPPLGLGTHGPGSPGRPTDGYGEWSGGHPAKPIRPLPTAMSRREFGPGPRFDCDPGGSPRR